MLLDILPVLLAIVVAQISPGPNMMAVSSHALATGRRAALYVAAGVATGVFIWAILFSLGIGTLLDSFPQLITGMKFAGGSYLLYMAFRAFCSARHPRSNSDRMAVATKLASKAYLTGLLVVLTNPKAALMWVAISMFLATAGLSFAQYLLIGATVSLSAMIIYGVYAVLFSTNSAMQIYHRFSRWIEGCFGILFGALGAKLLVDGFREIRA